MTDSPRCYIAGLGLISAIGANVQMNQAAYRAGINRYCLSDYRTKAFKMLSQAVVPEQALEELSEKFSLGSVISQRPGRIIQMAQKALSELRDTASYLPDSPVPLFQSCPEPLLDSDHTYNSDLVANITIQSRLSDLIDVASSQAIVTGRTGVIDGIGMAFRYLKNHQAEFVLVGGADSFDDPAIFNLFEEQNRLLHEDSTDGFVPGDGAGYLLLTANKRLALWQDNKCVYLTEPAMSSEPGHLFSDQPYRGDGLASCFSTQLSRHPEITVDKIYSSMNGEYYWAKEYGVARTRNSERFSNQCELVIPADCYGDLGAACGGALIALAATDLWNGNQHNPSLVYCSSDREQRASILVGVEN